MILYLNVRADVYVAFDVCYILIKRKLWKKNYQPQAWILNKLHAANFPSTFNWWSRANERARNELLATVLCHWTCNCFCKSSENRKKKLKNSNFLVIWIIWAVGKRWDFSVAWVYIQLKVDLPNTPSDFASMMHVI